jgi:hypothetical protein
MLIRDDLINNIKHIQYIGIYIMNKYLIINYKNLILIFSLLNMSKSLFVLY